MHTTARQFLLYVVSGTVAVVVHVAMLVAQVELFDIDKTLATAVGFVVASLVNFLLQRRFVFRHTDRAALRLLRYAVVTAMTLVLNTLIFHALLELEILHYTLAQLVTTAFVFVVNFAINAAWTFRKSETAPCGG